MPNTGFYLTDITIPVSFSTIESGRNNNIYFTKGDHLFIVDLFPTEIIIQ